MVISDVRVKLIEDANDRLRAVCSVTFDGEFVVRDVKVVDGTNGLFVAMPSRKLSVHCPSCRHKNHLRSRFCNECGAKLPASKASADDKGRVRLHRDIAHPINPTFREMVQLKVIESYKAEVEASRQPGYKPVTVEEEEESTTAEPTVERLSDPVEVTQEMTEYDALIAGLKSGGAPRPDSDRGARPPQQRPPRPPAPREAQRSGNDRRPGSDGRGRPPGGRPGQEPRRDRGPDRPGSRPARGPAPNNDDAQREQPAHETTERVHYDFADDIEQPTVATAPPPPARPAPPPPPRREPPPPARKEPVQREPRRAEAPPVQREERRPTPAPPPPAADNDGEGFGAGIL